MSWWVLGWYFFGFGIISINNVFTFRGSLFLNSIAFMKGSHLYSSILLSLRATTSIIPVDISETVANWLSIREIWLLYYLLENFIGLTWFRLVIVCIIYFCNWSEYSIDWFLIGIRTWLRIFILLVCFC